MQFLYWDSVRRGHVLETGLSFYDTSLKEASIGDGASIWVGACIRRNIVTVNVPKTKTVWEQSNLYMRTSANQWYKWNTHSEKFLIEKITVSTFSKH